MSRPAVRPAITDSDSSAPTADSTDDCGSDTSQDPGYSTPATENDIPSYKSIYSAPPAVVQPYDPANALVDLPGVSYALETFLASQMVEAEEYCNKSDVKKERLYFATGYGLIQCVKGLMSYADEDLIAGIGHTKQGNLIASQHRKKAAFFTSRLAGYVVSSLNTTGVGFIKSMTDVERHAELVYAESLFEKALLGIVYSGDWLAFIKEALNMRTTINIYRLLFKFCETMDAEAVARGEGPIDKSIDAHFRSGVYLGTGMSTLILSLLPTKLLTIVELFGYKGDRHEALEILSRAGGWTKDSHEPGVSTAEEGVRRSICDMALLIFHLVLSSFTFDGIDVSMAQKIIDWNLKRYPNGVFFLFGAGRLGLVRSQPQRAIEYYTKAMEVQKQYRNLHHVSHWEIAIANLALWDLESSLKNWTILQDEATWSKCIYSYGMAVCLLESSRSDGAKQEEAAKLMEKVPGIRQKIAGKSIPGEKFVARKARKFIQQGNRLALPALELAYIFLGIAHAPRRIIIDKMLPEVDSLLTKLKDHEKDPDKYENGRGYWDDFCLAKFLEGVCMRYVAYPDRDALLDPNEVVSIPKDVALQRSLAAFQAVMEYGPRIELDHHLVYHAHYELGRLLGCDGRIDEAKHHFELVLSGKYLEVGPSGKKGRYSLEGALHMRTHAALEALHQKRL